MKIKQIPYQPNYAVSELGDVYAIEPEGLKKLKQDISNGYPRVKLNGKKYYVSALVASEFMPVQPADNYKIFYIDGNHLNCAKDNLVWLDKSDIQRYSMFTPEYRRTILGEWA